MPTIVCPNCGYKQNGGMKCVKCASLFVYLQGAQFNHPDSGSESYADRSETGPSVWRRIYRVFRWASLASLVLALVLIFHKSPAPQVPIDLQGAERAEAKLEAAETAAASGQSQLLRLDGSEVNGLLHQNLALKPDENSPSVALAPAPAAPDPSLEQVQSSVKDVKVAMHDDRVEAYVVFDFHGTDLSLDLEGRLHVADGYIHFEPTSGKLGSLPIPPSTLESAVQRMLDSPENREKLRVPANIIDMRIENGELVVEYH